VVFSNKLIFYGEELLAPRPTNKLEDHPLSAVRDCLFNIFAATLQNWREPLPIIQKFNNQFWAQPIKLNVPLHRFTVLIQICSY
jgi:hypothetical protein